MLIIDQSGENEITKTLASMIIISLTTEESNALIQACLLAEGNQTGGMLDALMLDLKEMNVRALLPAVRQKIAEAVTSSLIWRETINRS
jgi:hypothetical protein